jgi:hypothetical protein
MANARHFMPVGMTGVMNRGVDARLDDPFARLKLCGHWGTPFNSRREFCSIETLLRQLKET